MEAEFVPLERMLDVILGDSRAHVCVYDAAGVLRLPSMALSYDKRYHASGFCAAAKKTARGYELCMRCKTRANQKAMKEGRPFAGYCPFGMYELAWPVRMGQDVVCVCYLGNLMRDEREAVKRASDAARVTGADEHALIAGLRAAQSVDSLSPYWAMAEALDSYLRLLLTRMDWKSALRSDCRWKARETAAYIDLNFQRDISLRQLAALYFVNEKYLGRVFHAEMGVSLRQYLCDARLDYAARVLSETNRPVLEVALDSGFQNVPYFHRLFLARFGQTPLAYRRAHPQAYKERGT